MRCSIIRSPRTAFRSTWPRVSISTANWSWHDPHDRDLVRSRIFLTQESSNGPEETESATDHRAAGGGTASTTASSRRASAARDPARDRAARHHQENRPRPGTDALLAAEERATQSHQNKTAAHGEAHEGAKARSAAEREAARRG